MHSPSNSLIKFQVNTQKSIDANENEKPKTRKEEEKKICRPAHIGHCTRVAPPPQKRPFRILFEESNGFCWKTVCFIGGRAFCEDRHIG